MATLQSSHEQRSLGVSEWTHTHGHLERPGVVANQAMSGRQLHGLTRQALCLSYVSVFRVCCVKTP